MKRALLLCLGLWLIAPSGLAAHAGPCGMERPAIEAAAPEGTHAHCDMMAAPEAAAPDHPDTDANCCCPAVLTALPSPALPDTGVIVFAQAPDFQLEARAASRTLVPEPRPPKA